jgi:hypothetical protein
MILGEQKFIHMFYYLYDACFNITKIMNAQLDENHIHIVYTCLFIICKVSISIKIKTLISLYLI